jgi:prepilin-type N-terminal cleavage/methylation domain-containing protein
MDSANNRAFTLVELLTVLAIIAVLVAILFPVFSRAREQARQASCISNMQEIHVKISLYHDDYDAYPPLLLGWPENPDGSAWQQGSGSPVSAGNMRHGFLYPSYIRDIGMFRCPNNPITDPARTVNAEFAAGAGFTGNATAGTHGIEAADPNTPIPFHLIDSYDITAMVGRPGTYQVVYSRDWTNAEGRGIDTRTDNPNQLKYPNPPLDKTVIAWCNYHVLSGSSNCTVLMGSGARTVPSNQMQTRGWNLAGD